MTIGGWVGQIAEIDLTTGEVALRDTLPYVRECLGGRCLASQLAWERIPAGIDAFDSRNCIIICTGPLTGTLAPTSGRTIMSAVSPRTYPAPWYTHSTLGGWFGPELKYAGYDALVIHGCARYPVMIEIVNGCIRLVDATDIWGQGARDVQLRLKRDHGARTQALVIGPAGEHLIWFATVQHSEDNAAGHSGFGAVWGSKRLKAIAVRGSGSVKVAQPGDLLHEVLASEKHRTTPYTGVLAGEGRHEQHHTCSQACTFNCMVGGYFTRSDGRRVPSQCVGHYAWDAGNHMEDTLYEGGGVRVPPGRNFTAAREVRLLEDCNSLGLDVWFRLVMQPWLIRASELGVGDIRGHPIDATDGDWFEEFMWQLAFREGLGDIFAEDLRRAVDELEDELPAELVTLGRELEFNFGFPAHREGRFWDEEPLPFWVISAMMHVGATRDPTIGAHQSGLMLAPFLLDDRDRALRQFRRLSQQVWGNPDALDPTLSGKAPVAMWLEHQHMLIDSLPLCDFGFPQLVRTFDTPEEFYTGADLVGDLDIDRRLLEAVTGQSWTREELDYVAERAFTLERLMLAQSGRGRGLEMGMASHFRLPCRADGTRIDEADFAALVAEYYAARGWDIEHGWPAPDLLSRLGLASAIPVAEEFRPLDRPQGSRGGLA